jgi:hypothetical protein
MRRWRSTRGDCWLRNAAKVLVISFLRGVLFVVLLVSVVAGRQTTPAYWCPVHPDVRAAERSVCHRCGMTLAPMDARAFAENGLDVGVARGRKSGTVALTLRVTDQGALVREFETVHERLFHLFVVSSDLSHFDHVHPELGADGAFRIELPVPRPGFYRLVGDFYPKGGVPQTLQRTVVTPGFAGPLFPDPPALVPDARAKTTAGLQVTLDAAPFVAGREVTLTFRCLDAVTSTIDAASARAGARSRSSPLAAPPSAQAAIRSISKSDRLGSFAKTP